MKVNPYRRDPIEAQLVEPKSKPSNPLYAKSFLLACVAAVGMHLWCYSETGVLFKLFNGTWFAFLVVLVPGWMLAVALDAIRYVRS